jgi:hypothetical protein
MVGQNVTKLLEDSTFLMAKERDEQVCFICLILIR